MLGKNGKPTDMDVTFEDVYRVSLTPHPFTHLTSSHMLLCVYRSSRRDMRSRVE